MPTTRKRRPKNGPPSKVLRQKRSQHLDIAYGPKERNKWDLYPASDTNAPCMIHIGDYWQRGSKEQFACVAEGALARGAGSEYHQPFALDQIARGDLVIYSPVFLCAGILSGKQPKPSIIPTISSVARSGSSKDVCPIRPVVKAWSATIAGFEEIIRVRLASRIASEKKAQSGHWQWRLPEAPKAATD